jgi:uncharacterized membrane protein
MCKEWREGIHGFPTLFAVPVLHAISFQASAASAGKADKMSRKIRVVGIANQR